MTTQSPYNKYVSVAVNTSSQEHLVLMLYDAALKFSNQAVLALDENNLMKLTESVKRAMDIIRELQLSLKLDYEISGDLYALYHYTKECLVVGNTELNREMLVEACDLLKEFRDTWREAIRLTKG